MERVSGVCLSPPYIVLLSHPGTLSAGCCFTIFLILCGGFLFGEGGCLSETNIFDLHVMFSGFLSRDAVT